MEFGVIIACSGESLRFARGCCASVRYFMPEVPICLIVDGRLSVDDLVRTYGATVLDRDTVMDPTLRARSFGWGLTKMIAFWESPWETFLCLDPDTMVWGDVARFGDFAHYDVLLDQQFARAEGGGIVNPLLCDFLDQPSPDAALRRQVVDRCLFDLGRLEEHFPDFAWRDHLYGFSWTGAFFARRGLFPLGAYVELLDFAERHPGVFIGGEMGFLNFMVFSAVARGSVRATNEPLQVLVCEEDPTTLRQRFSVSADGPVVRAGDAAVIHWTGPRKPTLWSRALPAPMTFMRRRHLRDAYGATGLRADWMLLREDLVGGPAGEASRP
jgi:hypothetical protein